MLEICDVKEEQLPKHVNREMLAGECEKLKENSNIEYMLNYLKSHK